MRYKKYVLYLLLVVFAGGLGCWISLTQYILEPQSITYQSFLGNLATYAISVAFLALADHLLLSRENPDASLGLFLLLLVIGTLGFSVFSMIVTKIDVTYYAIAGAFMAMFCWGIVNLGNRLLVDTINPESALGGEAK